MAKPLIGGAFNINRARQSNMSTYRRKTFINNPLIFDTDGAVAQSGTTKRKLKEKSLSFLFCRKEHHAEVRAERASSKFHLLRTVDVEGSNQPFLAEQKRLDQKEATFAGQDLLSPLKSCESPSRPIFLFFLFFNF